MECFFFLTIILKVSNEYVTAKRFLLAFTFCLLSNGEVIKQFWKSALRWTLHKICQHKGSLWHTYFCIVYLYGRKQWSEKTCVLVCFTHWHYTLDACLHKLVSLMWWSFLDQYVEFFRYVDTFFLAQYMYIIMGFLR